MNGQNCRACFPVDEKCQQTSWKCSIKNQSTNPMSSKITWDKEPMIMKDLQFYIDNKIRYLSYPKYTLIRDK